MAYKNLNEFVKVLESSNELVRINEYASPVLEISEIVDRISKHKGKALLFENNGTSFPVLINAFGSEKRMCLALGVNTLDEIGESFFEIIKQMSSPKETLFQKLKVLPLLKKVSSWMPVKKNGKGECQEIFIDKPDLLKLPVLTCWPFDGGPFITLPVVHTLHPETKIRNMGMYRMQIFDKETTGMHWHLHKNSAAHFREYKKLGKRMPVTVTLGGDPVYTYVASAPLPENFDEYILAGFLRKKKVSLVKCITNEIEIPEDVDFVIEGYIDPNEDFAVEGPFGDHTGFYSLVDYYPKFHVTCITHKKNAIYPATIVGIPPQEDEWLGKATERIFLSPIKATMQPEVIDMHMPVEGVFHNLVLFKVDQQFSGQLNKVIHGLWGAGQMMFTKVTVGLDVDFSLSDYPKILKYISDNLVIEEDVLLSKGPADVLEHASTEFAFGGKLGIVVHKRFDISKTRATIDEEKIKSLEAITEIHQDFLKNDISIVVLKLDKKGLHNALTLGKEIVDQKFISGIKCLIMVDDALDLSDKSSLVWLVLSNIDPLRDIAITNKTLIVDGTFKTAAEDNFKREWPNIIVMDDATIAKVDAKWASYNLGEYISSPSLKYKSLKMSDGASVSDKNKKQ